ncbi:MAG: DNA polymerase III subunits gamma and tau (EC [uncultured Sulfurovum sp.]|uniref:DNA polymerase III subunit gamma/tau n=1 Tax=uncultured Sulfurovum sp. TaxID=269237 RepID=A0A6S6T1C5_9BACT|nr:MAG: DNA polymerase III subunits gamma and tau (EC [uncultured Sulfurovum sp.]
MSLALARKYRPATFDDLIGQEAVSQTLSLALESDRLSHAYLFSGLRGSGKTSTARIFAKALLCEKGSTSHPCGVCDHCVMASESRHMDIIEMDAASNRKIDDIRELIEHTKYKPSTARYKIFIIDEVHMLTKEAFNALLKTLEEPPPFVKFILATTDPLKLPATILSRTQHFRFRNIPQSVVSKHLAHILNLEKVEYEQNALDIIARSGAGSVRDSLTLLDQAIVYSKNFINIETVTKMLGIIEPSMLEALLDAVLEKDEAKILEFVNSAAEFEAEMVIDEFMLHLKELLLAGSQKIKPMIIERFFRILAESKGLLNMGADGDFVLSLTLFKMMEALQIKDIDGMIRTLEKELSGVTVTAEPVKEVSIQVKVPKSESSISVNNQQEVIEAPIQEEPIVEPQATIPEPIIEEEVIPVAEAVEVKPLDAGAKLFEELIVKMYDRNYELGECFKHAIIYTSFSENTLTWESAANAEQKTLLKNNWMTIRTFVQELFGYETKIKNNAKELPSPVKRVEVHEPINNLNEIDMEEPTSMIEDEVLNQPIYNEPMLRVEPEEEMKSSCISPGHDGVEAAKEKDERNILDEPMIAKALELFNPKTVRVKRK